MESLQKTIKTDSGNKKFLKSNEKCNWKPLQQTGTSGRQNFRAQRQNRYKEKTKEFFNKKVW
jgi:hypothetical protein